MNQDISKASNHYLPALDGLRAISIVLVLLSHAGLQNVVPGGLGVLVFFVISGFLLTRQMIVEIEGSGTLNIGAFYLRRFLRLAPALLAYVILFTVLLTCLGAKISPVQVASGVFYFANYYGIFTGYPEHNPFPILWSLAVEEHYYLLFPFCMWMFRHRLKGLLPFLCAVVATVLGWRLYIATTCAGHPFGAICGLPGGERIFHGTDTIFDCILYGAIAAMALHYHSAAVRRLCINPTAFVLALVTLLFTLLCREPLFRDTLRFSLQSIAIAVLMINVLFGDRARLRQLLSHPALVLVGRLSYSRYLFHFGTMIIIDLLLHSDINLHHPIELMLYAAGSVMLAGVSYTFIERPMIAWRKRFGSHGEKMHDKSLPPSRRRAPGIVREPRFSFGRDVATA